MSLIDDWDDQSYGLYSAPEEVHSSYQDHTGDAEVCILCCALIWARVVRDVADAVDCERVQDEAEAVSIHVRCTMPASHNSWILCLTYKHKP